MSLVFDFASRGADKIAGDFAKTGSSAALAAKNVRLCADTLERQERAGKVAASGLQTAERVSAMLAVAEHELDKEIEKTNRALAAQGVAAKAAGKEVAEARRKASGGFGKALSGAGGLGGAAAALGLAGVASGALGILPAVAAAGTGVAAFGALALPTLKGISDAMTQVKTDTTAYDRATTAAGKNTALAHIREDWAKLSPGQAAAVKGIQALQAGFGKLATALAPLTLRVLNDSLKVLSGLLPSLAAFARPAGEAIDGLVKAAGKFTQTAGFKNFVSTLAGLSGPAITTIGRAVGTLAAAIGKVLLAVASPGGLAVFTGLVAGMAGTLSGLASGLGWVTKNVSPAVLHDIGIAILGIYAATKLWAVGVAAVAAAQKIAAAVTVAWGLAMDALPWVALAAAVVAVAVLIIKYHKQIWAFAQRVWHDVLAVIMACWTWIRRNWPLLLAIITGPIGIATLAVIKNWKAITSAGKTAWLAVTAGFRWLVGQILNVFSGIIHGAAAAFGWVPGLGGKLRGAAAAFDRFKASVNRSLGGINGRTVNVGVAMTSKTNPYPGGISGRAAAGMYVARGRPGVDDQLILAQRGELVVPTRMVRAGAVDHLRGQIPGFAAGGPVGVNVAAHTPSSAQVESTLMGSVMKLAKAFAAAASAISAIPGRNVGSGVMRWAPLVLQALKMEGLGSYLASQVLYQMQTESGGNPNIFNTTDINAQHGTPSGGLLQVIGPTFRAYHWPGTSFNLLDPLANIAAAINYARHRYGPTLMSGGMGMGSGHGYDQGGYLPVGWSMAYNGTGRPEPVGPTAAGGGGNTYHITVNVPPTASKADTGRVIVEHIREYERGSGARWRK